MSPKESSGPPRGPIDRSVDELISVSFEKVEVISNTLATYGQHLFRNGAAYNRFSETINAVASVRPGIGGSLSSAWDLVFAWLTEEPHVHHRALSRVLGP